MIYINHNNKDNYNKIFDNAKINVNSIIHDIQYTIEKDQPNTSIFNESSRCIRKIQFKSSHSDIFPPNELTSVQNFQSPHENFTNGEFSSIR